MAFVVFNKETGRYLNSHSGSFNRYFSRVKYKLLGYGSCSHRYGSEEYRQYWTQQNKVIEGICFQSDAGDSRMYKTSAAVITSFYAQCYRVDGKRVMPDHLVIREVVAVVAVVVVEECV